ncbi:plasma membrane fusion protein prm1 [Coemansia sp. BCRC 34301]|nr:plasma membrane fusion protein prm1 [Coemansia sp. BCRC 34301]
MVNDNSGGHGFPRDEKNSLGEDKPPYSYNDDYVHEDEDEYEGMIFKKADVKKPLATPPATTYPDEKKQPVGIASYPDEKKQPAGPNSYPDEKSYPMDFDTYASTSGKAPAVPEPEADEFFYPINNSSFASRNQSIDPITLAKPSSTKGKHSSLMSDELDRTFTDDASLNNLKKYDDIYEDDPHEHYRRSRNSGGHQPIPVPASQNHGYYGRNDEQMGGDMNEKQGESKKEPETSPYVGRWAQMSRAWASQLIVMMLFTAFSYYLLAQDAHDMAEDILLQLTSACLSLESATNSVINAPRSVAISTVTMVQNTAQAIIDVTGRSFIKTLSILENLVTWVLRMYLGTYICIAEVIIRTALKIAADVAKILTDALEIAVNTVVGGLQNVAAEIAGGLEKGINEISNFFTGGKKPNAVDFNIEDIRKQLTISIPTDWTNNIAGLADKIPTQEQIFGNIEQLLNVPFKLMTDAINGTFSKARVNLVNSTTFADEKFSDMCGVPMGKETVTELSQAIMWIMYIAAIAFLGAAVAVLIFELYSINRGENKFQVRLTEFRQDLTEYKPHETKEQVEETPATRQELDFFMLPGRPWFQRATNILTKKYGDTEKTTAWRWYLDYIWHPPAIACFVIGAMGLVSIFVQISAIEGLREVYIPKFAIEFNKFQDQFLGDALLGGVRNDSIALAASINGDITSSEASLDRTLFAPIDDGTTSLNNTLNDFVGTYIGGIRSVFGGTPLEYPIEGLVNCTLTKNIQSIQKVLTFVNEYAGGITFPRVNDTVLYDPVLSLMKPVNKSVTFMREFAVGVYVPNADSLDPMSFLPDEDMKRSAYAASLSSKYSSLHPNSTTATDTTTSDSSVLSPTDGSMNAATDLANNPELVPGAVLMRRDNLDTLIPNLLMVDSLPVTGDANIMTALDTDTLVPSPTADSGLSNSSNTDPLASLTKYGTKPTSELTREEVEGAQRYDGYTGGILNKLCDAYITRLRDRIPLMVALMASWVIVVILGLVNVARNYRRIKRENLQ